MPSRSTCRTRSVLAWTGETPAAWMTRVTGPRAAAASGGRPPRRGRRRRRLGWSPRSLRRGAARPPLRGRSRCSRRAAGAPRRPIATPMLPVPIRTATSEDMESLSQFGCKWRRLVRRSAQAGAVGVDGPVAPEVARLRIEEEEAGLVRWPGGIGEDRGVQGFAELVRRQDVRAGCRRRGPASGPSSRGFAERPAAPVAVSKGQMHNAARRAHQVGRNHHRTGMMNGGPRPPVHTRRPLPGLVAIRERVERV